MKRMRRLNALGKPWQLATYVGMIPAEIRLSVTYTERFVKVSIFGNENNYVDLDELGCWISSNVAKFDSVERKHTDDCDYKWIEVTWKIKEK